MEEKRIELVNRLQAVKTPLGIDAARSELDAVSAEAAQPTLWDDQKRAVTVLARQKELRDLLVKWDDTLDFIEMLDADSADEAIELENNVREFERRALLSGTNDTATALLTIHAGTGGVDAQDWAAMLERMFLRYVEQGRTEQVGDRTLAIDRTDWSAAILDRTVAEEAGIKTVSIEVKGAFAYGLLKAEAGVHRLVRISPFGAKGLRQTSFALVEVIPVVEGSKEVHIPESDLRIDVYRSGGAGGQHVNTTDSAVRITHLPTGIVVAIQNERSQGQNKATAMKVLGAKLAKLQELRTAEELATLKGEFKEGTWGNQIRSYVMQPYQMVKDHRTEHETSNISVVLDGELGPFIEAELLRSAK
jgi:peptide chain release factor 2